MSNPSLHLDADDPRFPLVVKLTKEFAADEARAFCAAEGSAERAEAQGRQAQTALSLAECVKLLMLEQGLIPWDAGLVEGE